jgi:uncharacterized protein (DUF885 family)
VLDEQTRTTLDGLPFDDHLMPLDSLNSIAVQMPVLGLGGGMQPFRTVRDYESFLTRIRAFSSWADLAITRSREGIGKGFTQPRPVVLRLLPQLEAQVVARPKTVPSGDRWSGCPPRSPPAERERLTRAYREAITGTVIPTYRRLVEFVKGTYAAAARTTIAAEALPDGPARYAARVRRQTTTGSTRTPSISSASTRSSASTGRSRRCGSPLASTERGSSSWSRSPPIRRGR